MQYRLILKKIKSSKQLMLFNLPAIDYECLQLYYEFFQLDWLSEYEVESAKKLLIEYKWNNNSVLDHEFLQFDWPYEH